MPGFYCPIIHLRTLHGARQPSVSPDYGPALEYEHRTQRLTCSTGCSVAHDGRLVTGVSEMECCRPLGRVEDRTESEPNPSLSCMRTGKGGCQEGGTENLMNRADVGRNWIAVSIVSRGRGIPTVSIREPVATTGLM